MITFSKETLAVCLLDDDPSILESTGRLLDSAGWKVEAFTDPITFLEHAAMHRPGVAVIDIRMPEINGLEVQTRLRRVSPSTRVIVLTSKDDPSVCSMAMNQGLPPSLSKAWRIRSFSPESKLRRVPRTSFPTHSCCGSCSEVLFGRIMVLTIGSRFDYRRRSSDGH